MSIPKSDPKYPKYPQGHNGLIAIRQALMDGWIKETTLKGKTEKRLFESLSISLGLGEASSMAVAETRNLSLPVTTGWQ